MVLHPLEASDRLPENHPGARVFIGHFENLLTRADFVGAQDWERLYERAFDNSPVADEVICGDRYILEADFHSSDHEARCRPNRNTGRVSVNQREHNAATLHACGTDKAGCRVAIIDEALRPV